MLFSHLTSGGHPSAFGVFKPVGHVVMAFAPDRDFEGALAEMSRAGFDAGAVQCLAPQEMVAQADIDIARASPMASLGQELNLVKTQRELATAGYTFLVASTPNNEQVNKIEGIARLFGAARAQHYGRWMIEELIEVGTTDRQVSESPDRGLDLQTTPRRSLIGST